MGPEGPMILGGGRWPPCANVSPDWFVPEGRMRRGAAIDGGDNNAFPCPTSVHLEMWLLHASLRDAAYLGHWIPGAIGPRLLPRSPPGSKTRSKKRPVVIRVLIARDGRRSLGPLRAIRVQYRVRCAAAGGR